MLELEHSEAGSKMEPVDRRHLEESGRSKGLHDEQKSFLWSSCGTSEAVPASASADS